MKLTTIEIEAFRGFNRAVVLDFDADVVVLYGRNGFGKSAVFDAITWCIFGSSKRFGGTRDYSRAEAHYLTNAFRTRGEERVKLTLGGELGEVIAERKGNEFYLYIRDEVIDGAAGERELLGQLGFEGASDEPLGALQQRARDSFSRSFLLHQDGMSEFVTAESPRDRFDAFAELFALTPIKDFYVHLTTERSQAADQAESLVRRYDVASAELRQMERQLENENERLTTLLRETVGSQSVRHAVTDRLRTLLESTRKLIEDVTWNESDPLNTVDDALLKLSSRVREDEDKLSALRILSDRAPLVSSWVSELDGIAAAASGTEGNVASAKSKIEELDAEIKTLSATLQDAAREIGAAETEAQRLHALLSDAIDAISTDECPICQRPIQQATLVAQLQSRRDRVDPRIGEITARRKALNDELRASQSERQKETSALRALETELQSLRAQGANLRRQIAEVRSGLETELENPELPDSQIEASLAERISKAEFSAQLAKTSIEGLRSIRPALELLRARQQVQALEEEAKQQQAKVHALARRRQAYTRARSILDDLVSASRRAERQVVETFIRRFRGPIQDAYRWLAPHPLFDELDFEFDDFNEAGELYFTVSDGATQLNPSTTFSSAQANALALAIFLALNAGQQWSPLALTLIDDPIQNQDDVNVLSLIDLLRNVSGERQLVVSTSVSHLHRLFLDKLRPTAPGKRLVAHTFRSLLSDGPTIHREVIEFTSGPRALDELERLSA